MSLGGVSRAALDVGFPRSRGDEPYTYTHEWCDIVFSPLTRG